MNKHISFVIFHPTGGAVRRLSLSLRTLAAIFVAGLVTLGCVGFLVQDYVKIRKLAYHTEGLADTVLSQRQLISRQEQQITAFTENIGALKEKILALNRYEEKIRNVANLKDVAFPETALGVGGPMPEDSDAALSLDMAHQAALDQLRQEAELLRNILEMQEQRFESLVEELENKNDRLARIPSIRPAKGRLSSTFGYRTSPFGGKKEFHSGIDISNKNGTPIVATADGKVRYAGKNGSLGLLIELDHGHGIVTRYGHNSELLKKKGDTVKRGETIALMGSTGRSTGPHLHYEILANGNAVNPKSYFLQ